MKFRVSVYVDVDAPDALAAADKASKELKDTTVFTVTRVGGRTQFVDTKERKTW